MLGGVLASSYVECCSIVGTRLVFLQNPLHSTVGLQKEWFPYLSSLLNHVIHINAEQPKQTQEQGF